MSKIFNKFLEKAFALIIILLLIVGGLDMLHQDGTFRYKIFNAALGNFPFIELMVSWVVKIIKYTGELPAFPEKNILEDWLKLITMSIINPVVFGWFSLLFLRVPNVRNQILVGIEPLSAYQERALNNPAYRMKKFIFSVLLSPIVAILSSKALSAILAFLQGWFKNVPVLYPIILVVAIIVIFAVSVMFFANFAMISLKVAIMWRLLITLIMPVIKMFFINFCCVGIAMSIMYSLYTSSLTFVFTLFAFSIIFDFALRSLKYSIST